MNKGLTIKTGQTHVRRSMQPLFDPISAGELSPAQIITPRAGLDEVPSMYRTFRDKEDGCIKVVITPGARRA